MKNKIIYETHWATRDYVKEYPHGWGFMPPFVEFDQKLDSSECSKKCKELSNDEFICYGATPRKLMYQISSNTALRAQDEINLLMHYSDPNDPPIIEDFVPEILALIDKFGNSGQSGGSAPYVASAICTTLEKLMNRKTLLPITGEEHEWMEVGMDIGGLLFQNNREGAIFKYGVDGKSYYLDAIVWKDNNCSWSGTAYTKDGIAVSSRQFIKSFPFTPKTFYIDVFDDGDTFNIIDETQLDEVFEYYAKQ
jgi:hypothetical protein